MHKRIISTTIVIVSLPLSQCVRCSNLTTCISSLLIHGLVLVGHPLKHRKRHRRKNSHNQELSIMRGVYFKNMKWQAAIKVDKKQIHLGTFGSQEEAAHLYDRYSFSESFLISLLTLKNSIYMQAKAKIYFFLSKWSS